MKSLNVVNPIDLKAARKDLNSKAITGAAIAKSRVKALKKKQLPFTAHTSNKAKTAIAVMGAVSLSSIAITIVGGFLILGELKKLAIK